MRLKQFLSITDKTDASVTVGITDRYRISVSTKDDVEYWARLKGASLTVEEEIYESRDTRTVSYLSIFDEKPASLLNRLRNLKILVLGCGGLGSRLILELASMGVGTIITTDPDTLDETNLARMPYFGVDDLGKNKTELITSLVSRLGLSSKVIGFPICGLEYCNSKRVGEFDFIFVTADGHFGNFLDHIGSLLAKSSIPHMPMGYWESTLVVGPVSIGKDLSKLRSHRKVYKRHIFQRDFTPPSIGFANSIVTGVAVNEMVKHFSNASTTLNMTQWQMDVFDLKTRLLRIEGL